MDCQGDGLKFARLDGPGISDSRLGALKGDRPLHCQCRGEGKGGVVLFLPVKGEEQEERRFDVYHRAASTRGVAPQKDYH